MATQTDLDKILAAHPTLFDDGLFLNNDVALQYYSGNVAKSLTRRTIPLDEFQSSVEWMESRKLRKDAGERGSEQWKKVMERETQSYVSHGAFIAAALYLNVPMSQELETPHPALGIKDQKGDF
jgi:hypothetical protein